MKNRLSIIKNGVLLLFSIILLENCSQAPENANPKSYLVEIKAMQFQPSELIVHRGDTIVFINRDILVHDVTEETNKAWTSSPLSTGQSFSLVVSENADYYCSIHPVMKGKLLVQ
ncbi:MAG: plastocyanin/azurin family copper-binding protein [Flavisolibacter sp.]